MVLEKKLKQLCERCGGGNSRWVYQSWVKSYMDTLLSKDLSTFPLQPAIDWLHGSLSTFLKSIPKGLVAIFIADQVEVLFSIAWDDHLAVAFTKLLGLLR